MKKILVSIYRFLLFFVMVAFVLTTNMTLFLHLLSQSADIEFTRENTQLAALFTFWNAVFLGCAFAIVNIIRRKIAIQRPINKILEVTHKLTSGDFSARVKPMPLSDFNNIITDLNKLAEELSSIETLRTDFISNVSHELKTPLAVLQNYGTLLEQPNLSEEKRMEYAKSIVINSAHLSELITNILKLNKLENQTITPNLKECCLSESICESLLSFENAWEKKNLEIETDIESDVYLRTDTELLSIVWNNLFSNAIKFTDNGGKIHVSLKDEGFYATICVADSGCGMDGNTIKRIFDKFYQGDTSHAMRGNGLGLALVKKVIDIFNGEISVESTPGVGTKFTVKLRKTP